MAYYNANEVIRLTRRAMGITQEELCAGICDVSTLSKMENGHYGVKRDVYRKLMGRMGRVPEMRYSICLNEDGRLLEDRLGWERAFNMYDYAKAESYLKKMTAEADVNVLTKQYLARAEAMLDHRRKRISAETAAERIDRAIRMTIPDYEKYLNQEKVFPFFKEELLALMSMGNAYRKMGQQERGRQMYEEVLRCLEANYIGDPDRTEMRISVGYNIARAHSDMENHVEAMKESETCLRLSKERACRHAVTSLLTFKAHCCVRLVEKEEWGKEHLDEAKKILRQAYWLAAARAEKEIQETIIRYYEHHLGEWNNF